MPCSCTKCILRSYTSIMKVLPFSVPECKRLAQKLVGGHERCAEYFAERV